MIWPGYRSAMIAMTPTRPVGELLRDWRQRRRRSQLDLALDAEVSARHISFLETGRAQPSREMLLRLAEQLDVPLRERNALLVAGGYAPIYPARSLDDDALEAARAAVDLVLAGHEPYPALAVDRHWTLVAHNRALTPFFAVIAPELREPPVNAMRVTLHPMGLAPRIVNFAQWRAHQLDRVRRQIALTADPALTALLDELSGYPAPNGANADEPAQGGDVSGPVVPMRLRTDWGILSFLYTLTVFGTPVDVTVAELAIESLFPADPATADALRRLSSSTA